MERKLVTVRRIVSIDPIPNADQIVLAKVDGWQSVIKKDSFNVGDLVFFAEIDSILPFAPWSEFLRDKKNPEKPIRLKTCKFKGTLSQGVILPLSIIDNKAPIVEGEDYTQLLGVVKYNPPIPSNMNGKIKGNFPSHIIPKTDSERLQNLWKEEFLNEIHGTLFVARFKEDGTSFTAFYHNGEVGLCSRNLQLDLSDSNNIYVQMFQKYNLENLFKMHNHNIAIQMEIVGPGIQKNKSNLSEKEIRVFDVYDIDSQKYFNYDDLAWFCRHHDLPQVKTLTDIFVFDKNKHNLEYMLNMTKQVYDNTNNQIEGLVYTPIIEKHSFHMNSRLRFKVINPEYLLDNEE